ncbi:MAG: phage holin family protein [Prevotella sp.]|nr:phage holin family protein [Prevotella sp.]MBR1558502.1 phage holin family protein [Prevotella sp.]
MLSSDKNVETIAQLIEVLKHYLGLQTEYVKLDVVDKVVRLLTATALFLLFFLIIIAMLMFFSFALAYWLGEYVSMPAAFSIVAGAHSILLLLFFAFRKPWIEKPLVRFLAGLLLSK